MQDLPVILKWDNLQNLDKALDFFIALQICKSDFYFLNSSKNVRWPLFTSFQCIDRTQSTIRQKRHTRNGKYNNRDSHEHWVGAKSTRDPFC